MDIQYPLGDPYFELHDDVLEHAEITLTRNYDEDDVEFTDFIMKLCADFAKIK